MERNRRVAKAYARAPILTINGSEDGFDGYRIGLNGFDNPLRDPKTDIVKHHIGDVSICCPPVICATLVSHGPTVSVYEH